MSLFLLGLRFRFSRRRKILSFRDILKNILYSSRSNFFIYDFFHLLLNASAVVAESLHFVISELRELLSPRVALRGSKCRKRFVAAASPTERIFTPIAHQYGFTHYAGKSRFRFSSPVYCTRHGYANLPLLPLAHDAKHIASFFTSLH